MLGDVGQGLAQGLLLDLVGHEDDLGEPVLLPEFFGTTPAATQPVAPNQGWGGYYVFNMPKEVRTRKTDLPLTITVTTGREVRRFNATLQYR